ncbi:hypothetical protein DFAR_1180009 [Desulfarculales bacterium]
MRETVRYSVHVPFWELEHYLTRNTLARAMGIPSRRYFADIHNHQVRGPWAALVPEGIIYHHCFLEWFVGGRWLKAMSSFDRSLSEVLGWCLVEFSAQADALLPAADLAGQPYITYLHRHGWRLGVPLEEFLRVTEEVYGVSIVEGWKSLSLEGGRG